MSLLVVIDYKKVSVSLFKMKEVLPNWLRLQDVMMVIMTTYILCRGIGDGSASCVPLWIRTEGSLTARHVTTYITNLQTPSRV